MSFFQCSYREVSKVERFTSSDSVKLYVSSHFNTLALNFNKGLCNLSTHMSMRLLFTWKQDNPSEKLNPFTKSTTVYCILNRVLSNDYITS